MTLFPQPLDQFEWILRQPDYAHHWKYSIYAKQGDSMVRVAVISGEPGQAQEHANALAIAAVPQLVNALVNVPAPPSPSYSREQRQAWDQDYQTWFHRRCQALAQAQQGAWLPAEGQPTQGEEGEGQAELKARQEQLNRPLLDWEAINRFLEAAVAYYETSAPTVSRYCDDLYIRIQEQPKAVALLEILSVQRLREDGVWLHPHMAANQIYHLEYDLGRDTTGQAGF